MTQTYTLSDLLEETTCRLKPIYKNAIDSSVLSIVWGHTCIFIEEQLLKGKAVTIQGLGTFTYIQKKQDLGTKGVRSTKTPLFVVSDSFCQANDVKKDHYANLTTSVSAVPMNNSLIASQSETSRDIVIDFQKEVIRGIGTAIRAHKGVSIELKNIGLLLFSSGVLKASFNSDFVAQFQVSFITKSGVAYEDSLPENVDPMTPKGPLSPKLKFNNFIASPMASRNNTPREDTREKNSMSKSVILPQVERPRHPMIKIRANSDSALRTTPFHDTEVYNLGDDDINEESIDGRRRKDKEYNEEEWDEEETCEHCIIAHYNDKTAKMKRIQDKISDEVSLRAQKDAFDAMDEKDQLSNKMLKARREDADIYNRTALSQKQETALKQKKMDFYGDVFYARKPDIPEHVKKSQYKSALQEQISDKQTKQKEKQQETKKEYEIFHETQKQADERARKMKLDEKQRHKDHGDFLVQQMTQKVRPKDEPRFERSVNPSLMPLSLSYSLSPIPPKVSEDIFRPSTADRDFKRRDFDSHALEGYKETIMQKKHREIDERAAQAKESLENTRVYTEQLQQQHQEETNKKMQTRDLLRSAWDSQLSQKRSTALAEVTRRGAPMRASLDLGQLALERNKPKHNCKQCGRHFATTTTNFRRTSGDFRIVK